MDSVLKPLDHSIFPAFLFMAKKSFAPYVLSSIKRITKDLVVHAYTRNLVNDSLRSEIMLPLLKGHVRA